MGRAPREPVVLVVSGLAQSSTRGLLRLGPATFPCALGRGGRRALKREGDGATPIGAWPVRSIIYRADRGRFLRTGLPRRPMRREDGWCEAPADRNYNRPVSHPYPGCTDRMWRDDAVYDVVVVLGYNDQPRRRGAGSAIFMHVARPGHAPTAGCIALTLPHLLRVLARIGRHAVVRVTA